MMIFWQRIARVIGFQKMYGLFGLNHHMLEKTCDVTPVTDVRTEEEESGKVAVVWLTRNRNKNLTRISGMKQHRVILSGGRALNKEEWEATEIVFRRLVHRHIPTRPLLSGAN